MTHRKRGHRLNGRISYVLGSEAESERERYAIAVTTSEGRGIKERLFQRGFSSTKKDVPDRGCLTFFNAESNSIGTLYWEIRMKMPFR